MRTSGKTFSLSKERKRRRKIQKQTRKQKLREFAAELNQNLPKSEQWFQNLYKPYRIKSDQFNFPFANFIPDLINKEFKYIIEIDGSIHNVPEVLERDKIKDKVFRARGFKVFRINHNDKAQFDEVMLRIRECRGLSNLPVKIYNKEEIAKLMEERKKKGN